MSAHIHVLQSVMYVCGFNHRLFRAWGDGLILRLSVCYYLYFLSSVTTLPSVSTAGEQPVYRKNCKQIEMQM